MTLNILHFLTDVGQLDPSYIQLRKLISKAAAVLITAQSLEPNNLTSPQLSAITHACNLSTWEAKAEGSRVQG